MPSIYGSATFLDGTRIWYKNRKPHRDNDQPAVIWANGNREWRKNGIMYRKHGKPAFVGADGSLRWYKNGIPLHEEQLLEQFLLCKTCINKRRVILVHSIIHVLPNDLGMNIAQMVKMYNK